MEKSLRTCWSPVNWPKMSLPLIQEWEARVSRPNHCYYYYCFDQCYCYYRFLRIRSEDEPTRGDWEVWVVLVEAHVSAGHPRGFLVRGKRSQTGEEKDQTHPWLPGTKFDVKTNRINFGSPTKVARWSTGANTTLKVFLRNEFEKDDFFDFNQLRPGRRRPRQNRRRLTPSKSKPGNL